MGRDRARIKARELKETCVERCGLCHKGNVTCPIYLKCTNTLGFKQKPQNFDLVDLIDFIEEKF